MDEFMRSQIAKMSYQEMLSMWRFSPSGNPLFEGKAGQYFVEKMTEKKAELEPGEAVRISKEIGW